MVYTRFDDVILHHRVNIHPHKVWTFNKLDGAWNLWSHFEDACKPKKYTYQRAKRKYWVYFNRIGFTLKDASCWFNPSCKVCKRNLPKSPALSDNFDFIKIYKHWLLYIDAQSRSVARILVSIVKNSFIFWHFHLYSYS